MVNFLSKATVTGTDGDLALTFDYTNPDTTAYPAVLVTYEIVCATGNKSSALPLLKGFMSYLAGSGQDILEQNGYVKLPDQHRQPGAVGDHGDVLSAPMPAAEHDGAWPYQVRHRRSGTVDFQPVTWQSALAAA